jgi:hypothetical protein
MTELLVNTSVKDLGLVNALKIWNHHRGHLLATACRKQSQSLPAINRMIGVAVKIMRRFGVDLNGMTRTTPLIRIPLYLKSETRFN